jgi:hypothetical protein
MKLYRWLFLWLCLLPLSMTTAEAQSYRLNSLSEQLATQAADLAERSYSDYANSTFSNRGEVEALFLAQQFSASANVFRRMVRDSRRASDLRDAASVLADLARRGGGGTAFSRRSQWASVQRTLEDVLRELNAGGIGGGGGGRGGRGDDYGRTTGRLRWRGSVDDDVHLVIREDRVEIRTIGGSEYNNATYNFTSPLPRRRTTVSVVRLKGRGDVRVIQQPSRDNDFTAVVQIRDPSGGAREYEIEVSW